VHERCEFRAGSVYPSGPAFAFAGAPGDGVAGRKGLVTVTVKLISRQHRHRKGRDPRRRPVVRLRVEDITTLPSRGDLHFRR